MTGDKIMKYVSEVIHFTKSAEPRARLIDEKANEMYSKGYELVSVCSTVNAGAILTFKKVD